MLTWLFETVAWAFRTGNTLLAQVGIPRDNGWNWALTMVLAALAVRVLLFPHFLVRLRRAEQSIVVEAQAQKIRQKYRLDKQRMGQELVRLYQENPTGTPLGRFVVVVQFLLFAGVFQVLRSMENGEAGYGLTAEIVHDASRGRVLGAPVTASFLTGTMDYQDGVRTSIQLVTAAAILIAAVLTWRYLRGPQAAEIQVGRLNIQLPAAPLLMVALPVMLAGVFLPLGLIIYYVAGLSWVNAQDAAIGRKVGRTLGEVGFSGTNPHSSPRDQP